MQKLEVNVYMFIYMNMNIYEVNELVHVKIHLLIQGHKYEHENKHQQELGT
jgi:hypothetical protein